MSGHMYRSRVNFFKGIHTFGNFVWGRKISSVQISRFSLSREFGMLTKWKLPDLIKSSVDVCHFWWHFEIYWKYGNFPLSSDVQGTAHTEVTFF